MKNISVTRDWTKLDWLLQSDSYNDWQLDGAVRLYLQRKPPSSKTNPSGHLCSTYPFYLAPLCLQLCSSPLHLITPSIYLSPFSPQASVSVSIHLYRFLPTKPHPPPALSSTEQQQPGFRLRRSPAPWGFLKMVGSPRWPSWRTFWGGKKKERRKNFLSSWIKPSIPFHVHSYIYYICTMCWTFWFLVSVFAFSSLFVGVKEAQMCLEDEPHLNHIPLIVL